MRPYTGASAPTTRGDGRNCKRTHVRSGRGVGARSLRELGRAHEHARHAADDRAASTTTTTRKGVATHNRGRAARHTGRDARRARARQPSVALDDRRPRRRGTRPPRRKPRATARSATASPATSTTSTGPYVDDGHILDPKRPESLVYEYRNGKQTVVAAMYMLPFGSHFTDVARRRRRAHAVARAPRPLPHRRPGRRRSSPASPRSTARARRARRRRATRRCCTCGSCRTRAGRSPRSKASARARSPTGQTRLCDTTNGPGPLASRAGGHGARVWDRSSADVLV